MGSTFCGAQGELAEASGEAAVGTFESARGAQLLCEVPGGRVAAAMGRCVDLLDGSSGNRRSSLEGHSGPVTCLLLEAGLLFSGSVDRTVRRWDPSWGGSLLGTMEGHTDVVWCLAAAEGSVFSAGGDGGVRRWDAKTGALLGVLQEHGGPVTCMLARRGVLYTGSEDATVRRWDLDTSEPDQTLKGHLDGVTCLLTAEGCVFSGAKDAMVRRWSLHSGALVAVLDGHDRQDWILCLHFANGGLFSGGRDGSICQWDLERNAAARRFAGEEQHEAGVTCFLSSASLLLSGSADGTVRLWDKSSGELVNILEGTTGVTCLLPTSWGTTFGGQARGCPQRLPPLARRTPRLRPPDPVPPHPEGVDETPAKKAAPPESSVQFL